MTFNLDFTSQSVILNLVASLEAWIKFLKGAESVLQPNGPFLSICVTMQSYINRSKDKNRFLNMAILGIE